MVRDGLDAVTWSRLGPSKHARLALVQRPHFSSRQGAPTEGKHGPGCHTWWNDISTATLDVTVNKPFKDPVAKSYREWLAKNNAAMTPTGRPKKARYSQRIHVVGQGCMGGPASATYQHWLQEM